MCVADVIRDVHHGHGAVVLELDFPLLEQAGEDFGGVLVVKGILLSLGELLLQLLDLVVAFMVQDVGELLNFHLFFHVCLCATALRTNFEEVGTAAVVGCTTEAQLE